MYNSERKQQFLDEKSNKAIQSNNLAVAFKAMEKKEERLGRDAAEWTSEEIIDFYKYLGTMSVQSLVQLHNSLTEYCTWCINNGLIKDNQNHYTEIKSAVLGKCVDTDRLSQFMLSREELLDNIRHLPNFSDQFLVLGIYEGIPMKNSVIYYVKPSDLNGNRLSLSNGDTIEISDDLVHIIHMAEEETKYVSMGERKTEYDYTPGENILRSPQSKRTTNNHVLMLANRLRKCFNYLGFPKGITFKMLTEAGRIDYIRRFAKQYNISPVDVLRDKDYRAIIEDRYGKIQNTITYIEVNWEMLLKDG